MQQELNGSQIIRLLKSHVKNTGKKLPVGTTYREGRKEAKILIENKIAELYTGTHPPKKMKTNFFKSKE